jgi:hypothetical protein
MNDKQLSALSKLETVWQELSAEAKNSKQQVSSKGFGLSSIMGLFGGNSAGSPSSVK